MIGAVSIERAVLYHQEMIPTILLDSFAKTKENVAFPTIIEIILMEISFELIREGGIRIPYVTGQTLGIIGALILGQSAVMAGLVSPILIIVVSVTGLGSFTITNHSLVNATRIMRYFFTLLAFIAGYYGLSIGIFVMGGLLAGVKSFGVPYLSPLTPTTKTSAGAVFRKPVWMEEKRPDYNQTPDPQKQPEISRGWTSKDQGDPS